MSSHSDPHLAHRRLQRFPSKGKLPRQAYPTASSAGVRAVSWQVLPRYDVMDMSATLPTQSRGRSSELRRSCPEFFACSRHLSIAPVHYSSPETPSLGSQAYNTVRCGTTTPAILVTATVAHRARPREFSSPRRCSKH